MMEDSAEIGRPEGGGEMFAPSRRMQDDPTEVDVCGGQQSEGGGSRQVGDRQTQAKGRVEDDDKAEAIVSVKR